MRVRYQRDTPRVRSASELMDMIMACVLYRRPLTKLAPSARKVALLAAIDILRIQIETRRAAARDDR